MPDQSTPHPAGSLAARTLGAALILLCLSVLLGWAAGIDQLKSGIPGYIAMNPLTAVNFGLLGLAVFIVPAKRTLKITRSLGLFVCMTAAARLSEYVWQVNFHVDQILFSSLLDGGMSQLPNRMAPNTAGSQLLLGSSILLFGRRVGSYMPSEVLAVPPAVVALFALVGYAYGITSFYSVGPFIPMAVHTAGGLLVTSMGVVLASSQHHIAKLLMQPTLAGSMTRTLLPVAIVLPAVIGWLRLQGERAGLYPAAVGVALFAVTVSTLFATLVMLVGASLQRADEQRVLAQRQLEQVMERLARSNAELERLATTDGLTGVLNRRAWLERLEAEIARATRYSLPLSALMIDADHFKAINDRYGHVVGDDVLRALAQLLLQRLRQSDLLARYGGEEFCICLPNTPLEGALVVAERLRALVRNLEVVTQEGTRVTLTCSIGVADMVPGRSTSGDVLRAADAAMYEAKVERDTVRAAPG